MCEFTISFRIEKNGARIEFKLTWCLQQNAREINLQFIQLQECTGDIFRNPLYVVRSGQGTRVSRTGRQGYSEEYNISPLTPHSLLKNDKCEFLFLVESLLTADGSLNYYNSSWWPVWGKSNLDLGASSLYLELCKHFCRYCIIDH